MKDKIIRIISAACALEENITENSELKLLSLDSLSFVIAVAEIENVFGIEFALDENEIFGWATVGDIIKNTEVKLNAQK